MLLKHGNVEQLALTKECGATYGQCVRSFARCAPMRRLRLLPRKALHNAAIGTKCYHTERRCKQPICPADEWEYAYNLKQVLFVMASIHKHMKYRNAESMSALNKPGGSPVASKSCRVSMYKASIPSCWSFSQGSQHALAPEADISSIGRT